MDKKALHINAKWAYFFMPLRADAIPTFLKTNPNNHILNLNYPAKLENSLNRACYSLLKYRYILQQQNPEAKFRVLINLFA